MPEIHAAADSVTLVGGGRVRLSGTEQPVTCQAALLEGEVDDLVEAERQWLALAQPGMSGSAEYDTVVVLSRPGNRSVTR